MPNIWQKNEEQPGPTFLRPILFGWYGVHTNLISGTRSITNYNAWFFHQTVKEFDCGFYQNKNKILEFYNTNLIKANFCTPS